MPRPLKPAKLEGFGGMIFSQQDLHDLWEATSLVVEEELAEGPLQTRLEKLMKQFHEYFKDPSTRRA